MKNKYENPSVMVFKLDHQSQLLRGSKKSGFGDGPKWTTLEE